MSLLSRRFFLLALPTVVAAGCSKRHDHSRADLDRARQKLEICLNSWKQGEAPEKLRSGSEPIVFTEEGPRNGLKLLDYEILGSEHTDNEAIRFTVKLSVEDSRARREERQATYAVSLVTSPNAVGRDPMY